MTSDIWQYNFAAPISEKSKAPKDKSKAKKEKMKQVLRFNFAFKDLHKPFEQRPKKSNHLEEEESKVGVF